MMRFAHHVFSALCVGSLLLAGTAVRANDNDDDRDDRVSLGVAVAERDGRLVIAHVIKDTPADEAGLRRGDEIRKVDGERVRNAREFIRKMEDKEEGDELELEVNRDDETKTFEIELASYRDVRDAAREDDDLRRRAREATSEQQIQQLARQVQELQRQVRQLQQAQQRDQQRFGQPFRQDDRQRFQPRDDDRQRLGQPPFRGRSPFR